MEADHRRCLDPHRAVPPIKPSTSRALRLRGLSYHLREWGDPKAPLLLMLHGWMDVSASFQFLVDALESDWHAIAPDWRGFGQTAATAAADCYWFPDYLADLERILDALAEHRVDGAPIALLGHSMGGNVAMLYAGIRPQRIRALINLEGFGLRDAAPDEAPARYARWLDELRSPPPLRDYASLHDVASRLIRNNPRLTTERAAFLAPHWSRPTANGRFELAADPAHRIVNPIGYRAMEAAACWDRIACPVLWIEGAHSDAVRYAGGAEEVAARRGRLRTVQALRIDDAGHMLHHDQPERVAAAVEAFLNRKGAR